LKSKNLKRQNQTEREEYLTVLKILKWNAPPPQAPVGQEMSFFLSFLNPILRWDPLKIDKAPNFIRGDCSVEGQCLREQ
jgi:hypothetical protein